jgi:hypothetical protein
MIWFSLLIPVIAIIFVATVFNKKMNLIEYLILFGVPLLAIVFAKIISTHSQTSDTEFLNTYITETVYYEPWNEWDVETCYEDYDCGEDKDGNTKTCRRSYDCSHVDYHSAAWEITDNAGNTYSINSKYYDELCRLWNNKKFRDMNRHFHSQDGDAYFASFDKAFEHIVPVCQEHTYENRVKCSKSVFNFQEVDSTTKSQYNLFDYPKLRMFDLGLNYNPILGFNNKVASLKLQQYNAFYGKSKQLHMMILVFENQPVDAAIMQEAYWKSGNKNEFIMCVGKVKDDIQWARAISWTEIELLKVSSEREIKQMKKFDIMKIVNYMGEKVPKEFVRKQFKDFNYLAVEPTSGALLATYIIVLVLSIGIAIVSVRNDF